MYVDWWLTGGSGLSFDRLVLGPQNRCVESVDRLPVERLLHPCATSRSSPRSHHTGVSELDDATNAYCTDGYCANADIRYAGSGQSQWPCERHAWLAFDLPFGESTTSVFHKSAFQHYFFSHW